MAQKDANIGKEIDKLETLRNKKKELQSKADEADKAFREQQDYVMELLDQTGQTRGSGQNITASIYEEEVFNVEDPDKFWRFMFRNKTPELVQNRVRAPAVRELEAQRRRPIPGLKKVPVKKLSVTQRK